MIKKRVMLDEEKSTLQLLQFFLFLKKLCFSNKNKQNSHKTKKQQIHAIDSSQICTRAAWWSCAEDIYTMGAEFRSCLIFCIFSTTNIMQWKIAEEMHSTEWRWVQYWTQINLYHCSLVQLCTRFLYHVCRFWSWPAEEMHSAGLLLGKTAERKSIELRWV